MLIGGTPTVSVKLRVAGLFGHSLLVACAVKLLWVAALAAEARRVRWRDATLAVHLRSGPLHAGHSVGASARRKQNQAWLSAGDAS